MALLVRAHSREAAGLLSELMGTLVELAERHLDWPLPGYTHLQRAQPVYLSHHLLAWFWKFRRDRRRFGFCLTATDALPLGAGALAGANFETDRRFVARELGFGTVAENSLDAVSNRDFVLDYMSAAALPGAGHLSQLGAEVVLWSTAEFGFCQASDGFASGSSLMPQKKNPDAAELLRQGAAHRPGGSPGSMASLHGLPLTYNKDLQEDKEPLFDTIDTLELCLRVAREMLAGVEFDRARMAEAASDDLIAATDLADLLVRDGMPFREAHGVVSGLVRGTLDRGKSLSELDDAELRELAPQLTPDGFRALLEQSSWLESKVSEGGTALPRVRDQLAQARHALDEGAA